jgi:hypothetical protein
MNSPECKTTLVWPGYCGIDLFRENETYVTRQGLKLGFGFSTLRTLAGQIVTILPLQSTTAKCRPCVLDLTVLVR